MARLKNLRALVELTSSQLQGPERQKQLAALATATINQATNANRAALGIDVGRKIFVDGSENGAVQNVRPGGTVVAIFAVQEAAADFAWLTLAQLSPIKSGDYREHHALLVNGTEAGPPPVAIQVDDVITFVNLLAYSRQIEHGWSKRQAPDGVYEAASVIVRARMGNIVDVKFGYAPFAGGKTMHGSANYPYLRLSPKYRRP